LRVWHTIKRVDTPGDLRPGRVTPRRRRSLRDTVRDRRFRGVTLGVAAVAAGLVIGLAIRAAGEPSAMADTPLPAGSPSPSVSGFAVVNASPSASPMLPPGQDVLVLGDSLALSTYAWLADLMPDRYVSWAAVVGRSTAQARQALEVVAAAGDLPPVIVVSSGTNDLSSASLRTEAERILAIAGPKRCVVWADVVRPDAFGDGMTAANDALAQALAGHLNVVPVAWTAIIAAHPDWLSGDGIHPGEAGNIARAHAFADAVFSCSPLDPDAPVAAKQYLPPSAFLAPGGHSVPGVGPSSNGSPSPNPSSSPSRSGSPSPTGSSSASPGPSDPGSSPSGSPEPSETPPPTPDPTTSPESSAGPATQP
jgi:lysophospholipase L1-like esterase